MNMENKRKIRNRVTNILLLKKGNINSPVNMCTHYFYNIYNIKKCRGRDLNPRTSAGTDLESVAVDLAWLPLHNKNEIDFMIIKVYVRSNFK